MSEIYQDGFLQGQYETKSRLRAVLLAELERLYSLDVICRDNQEMYTIRGMKGIIVAIGNDMGINNLGDTYPMVEVER